MYAGDGGVDDRAGAFRRRRQTPVRRDAEELYGLSMDRKDAEARATWTKDVSAAMQIMCRRRPGSTSCPSRPQGHGSACLKPSQPHYALKMLLPCARASLHHIDGPRFARCGCQL
jgi:hypothetical protein